LTQDIEQLRAGFRARRAALDDETLRRHARLLQCRVAAESVYNGATHIAAYIAIRGEIDVVPIIDTGANCGKQFYLPVLRGQQMLFAPWMPGDALQKRGFGLLEPDCSEADWRAPESLDLVLTPLVVFDTGCNRIGQGGGFYDRTFAFKKNSQSGPVLMGVAHDCQRHRQLPAQPWDVPLDLVITESNRYSRKTAE